MGLLLVGAGKGTRSAHNARAFLGCRVSADDREGHGGGEGLWRVLLLLL